MRNTIIILVLAGFLGLLTACTSEDGATEFVRASGNVITETRDVSDFNAIALDGFGRLVIEQTGSESLSISADDNIMPYIETTVENGKLIIGMQEGIASTSFSELTYNVTVEDINNLELNGAGDIEIIGLDGEDWEVTVSGGGNIEVSGRVDRQTIDIEGAGAYQAENLESLEATIRHDGAGIAVVQVSEVLNVIINGLGSVEYIGDPIVNEEINGLGTVHQR